MYNTLWLQNTKSNTVLTWNTAHYNERIHQAYSSLVQIDPSYTGGVAGRNECYSVVDKLPLGPVEVVVGEVFTPQRFWVLRYGKESSLQLDKLMDGMLWVSRNFCLLDANAFAVCRVRLFVRLFYGVHFFFIIFYIDLIIFFCRLWRLFIHSYIYGIHFYFLFCFT